MILFPILQFSIFIKCEICFEWSFLLFYCLRTEYMHEMFLITTPHFLCSNPTTHPYSNSFSALCFVLSCQQTPLLTANIWMCLWPSSEESTVSQWCIHVENWLFLPLLYAIFCQELLRYGWEFMIISAFHGGYLILPGMCLMHSFITSVSEYAIALLYPKTLFYFSIL